MRSLIGDEDGRPLVYLTLGTVQNREPLFREALAERVRQGLDRFPADIRGRVPVLFSAHSMPIWCILNCVVAATTSHA